jgi:hypothetical protein
MTSHTQDDVRPCGCADSDPLVLTHARALLNSAPAGRTAYIPADLREPRAILDDPATREALDLSQPTALMMSAFLPWQETFHVLYRNGEGRAARTPSHRTLSCPTCSPTRAVAAPSPRPITYGCVFSTSAEPCKAAPTKRRAPWYSRSATRRASLTAATCSVPRTRRRTPRRPPAPARRPRQWPILSSRWPNWPGCCSATPPRCASRGSAASPRNGSWRPRCPSGVQALRARPGEGHPRNRRVPRGKGELGRAQRWRPRPVHPRLTEPVRWVSRSWRSMLSLPARSGRKRNRSRRPRG